MGKEANIESRAARYAESKGIWTRKFVSPAHRSVPDRVFGFKKIVLWLEFKAPEKIPTEAQYDEIVEIRARGMYATWVDSLDDAKQLIDWIETGTWTHLLSFCESQNFKAKQLIYPADEPQLNDLI